MAENNNVKNKKGKPSKAKNKGEGNKGGLASLKELLTGTGKVIPRIAASVSAVILGGLAFWQGYGQWWFGFRVSIWVLIPIVVALDVIWLIAAYGYLSDYKNNAVRVFSYNTLLMIALPALVLGILGGYFAMHWRLTEKIVILVEPFEGDEKDPYYLAKVVKSQIEGNIRLLDRDHVKVVLGKKHKGVSGKEVVLKELALKYRADMVISGWHTKRGSKILVSANFHVVRVPQGLPAVFWRQESNYPRSLIFSEKEIENFSVHFTLGGLLGHESILMIGAGAYASGEWKTAEHYFRKALDLIEERPARAQKQHKSMVECFPSNARDLVRKRWKKIYSEEYIEGDKALLELYIGHCLFNQGHLDFAIDRYHKAVKQGGEIPKEKDVRYREILTNAYLGRGIAYREKNEFGLAVHDFQRLGEYSLFSEGFIQPHAYESLYTNKGNGGLKVCATRFYERGNDYLKNRAHVHAQSELETSVKMLRTLSNEVFTPKLKRECSFLLARSLVRLGEVHSRQALPDIWNDKHTEGAIDCLDEAHKIIKELKQDEADVNDAFEVNDLKQLHPDCLRHLGDVHRLMDRFEDVNDAINKHKEAHDLWIGINDVNMAAGEQTRIGNIYRRLDDLEPDPNYLDKAICAYKEAIKKLGGEEYLKIPYPVSNDHQVDVNEAKKIKKNLICETTKKIIIHHLAHSACNLAEAHIKQSLDELAKEEKERNKPKIEKNIRIACELLECAAQCYREAVEKLHKEKDKKWIKRIKEEERNMSLKDDLAWCLTLHGYALIKQGPPDPNDPNEYYEQLNKILTEAGNCFGELRDVDQSHRVLSLFALTVSQVKLGKKPEAQQTFRDACVLLKRLTREKKKVWYVDYVYDIMKNLPEPDFKLGTEDDKNSNLNKLKTWLTADTVREGRRALDKIIDGVDNILKKTGEAGS